MSRDIKGIENFIDLAPGFQYAINLEYDFESIDKIKGYIPTFHALEIIEGYLENANTSSKNAERAKILIGAYGKGKSHLMLVIKHLLFSKDKSLFTNLLEKMEEYNDDLYKLALKTIDSKEKLLPVIIGGNSLNLNQSFLISLKRALEFHELDDIMPSTYFNAAIDMIYLWKKEFQDTYIKFCNMVNMQDYVFIERLKNYDQKTYDKFLDIYPLLTSGGEFNPIEGIDVVDMYQEVALKIKRNGYKGIFIVYDEFSKFLEGSVYRNSAMEIKMLQDFAELCNRSGDCQIHLTLISHKHISNYVDRLPKEKIDAWKAVENRFKIIEMDNSSSQTYEIMSNVINKDRGGWDKFRNENRKKFNDLVLQTSRINLFEGLENKLEEKIVYGCYPMHPITTYILPRISEKIAQNERTVFTFLSTYEINALGYFIKYNKNRFPLMTPDYVYNYFETLFKGEHYNSDIYKTWKETINALNKVSEGEILKVKIIKTIGIIYTLDELNKIAPTLDILRFALISEVKDVSEIDNAINELIGNKILYFLKSKNYFKFIEATDIDVEALINDEIEKRKQKIDYKNILNDIFYDQFIYPTRYNDKYEIVRYFNFEFMDYSEFIKVSNWDNKVEVNESDGIVYAIITNTKAEYEIIKNKLKFINHDRIIFVISPYVNSVKELLQKFDAIKFLIGKVEYQNQDHVLLDELTIYFEDVKEQIKSELEVLTKPELCMSEYYYKGNIEPINRKAKLSQLASNICEKIYNKTPIIINEMINKNNPSNVARSNRNKVIDSLLKNNLENKLGLTGYGLDVNIMQSTLVVPGILKEDNDLVYLSIKSADPKMKHVLLTIRDFFIKTSTNGTNSFGELYEVLTKPKYNIGLKKGVIPIYLAVILHELKSYAVIMKNGREIEITAQLLDNINENPDSYFIFIEDWNEEKEKYIIGLENLFDQYIIEGEKEYNTFDYIVKAMKRWFLQLPKYTKEYKRIYCGKRIYKNIDKRIIKLRNNLRGPSLNSREFLFDTLFNIFGFSKFTTDILVPLQHIKNEMDSNIDNLIKYLSKDIKIIFSNSNDDNTTLFSSLRNWYETLNNNTRLNIFGSIEDDFLKLVKDMTADSRKFVENLAKTITYLRIDDWNDDSVEEFLSKLEMIKDNIEMFDIQIEKRNISELDKYFYKISFYNSNNELINKTFMKDDLSSISEILYNDISTLLEEEYGEAIDRNQKLQVLMKIIEEYC